MNSFSFFYPGQGCPKVVRADYGTENSIVAKLQVAFRMNHTDDLSAERSFNYGPSTANIVSEWSVRIKVTQITIKYTIVFVAKRVESLWSQWTRYVGGWWIDLCRVSLFLRKFTLLRNI